MSWPVGTVMVYRDETEFEVPVWIKTAQGWMSIIPSEARSDVNEWLEESDFESGWQHFLPAYPGDSSE